MRTTAILMLLGAAGCGSERLISTCGPGTLTAEDGTCRPDTSLPLSCGTGTHLDGTTCIADTLGDSLKCGEGTIRLGTECVPDTSDSLKCGEGTIRQGTECIPDTSDSIKCGGGTVQQGTECVPDTTGGVFCGKGTHQEGTECLPDPEGDTVACGTGTIPNGSECVAVGSDNYEIRTSVLEIPADGYSMIPVLAIGHLDDGTPSTETVVFGLTRPEVGTFVPTTRTLTMMGATSYFIPCNSALTPSCLGSFQITIARVSASRVVIASSSQITLVAPAGVGSPAACLGGGNVLFLYGDSRDWVHPGVDTITNGVWDAQTSGGAFPDYVHIGVTPSDESQGSWWDAEFGTQELNLPLFEQTYEGAERLPFASPGHPGIDIGGDGRGCNTIAGRFQIHKLTMVGSTLTEFTATFEQHCEAGSSKLRGCVHYEAN